MELVLTRPVNLTKSEIGHAQVTFLGHVVGGGMVKPLSAKVQVVTDYPPPANKKFPSCIHNVEICVTI